ncbi:MAG: choice-of-anchor Q domain-containing protein [Polyangiaceae bacterium]
MQLKLIIGTVAVATAVAVPVQAATIQVGANCSILEAIQAAETDAAVAGCTAGALADEILIPDGTDETWTAQVNITSELSMRATGGRAVIRGDTTGGYFTLLNVTGILTLEDITLRDGVSDGSAGCVLVPVSGTFTARRVVFDACGLSPGNTAGLPAGAIRNGGTMLLESCLIVNTTTNTTEAALRTNGGTTTLVNTTITASSASGIRHWNGTLDLRHSTIANNAAFDVRIRGARVANAYNSSVGTLEGSFTVAEGSLISADPMLGPLQDNGGPTLTMAPLQGSPVLDGANDAYCEAADQRGLARPSGDHCDIGAVEHQVTCDNGFLHPSEDCDGTQFQPQFQTCPQGYEGTPVCDATCSINGIPNGCTAIVDAGAAGSGGAGGSGGTAGSGGAAGSGGTAGGGAAGGGAAGTAGGSSGGGPQDAGTAGSPTYEGDGSTADAGVRSKKIDDGDCNCHVPGRSGSHSNSWLWLVSATFLAGQLRRRTRSKRRHQ